jgi:hypothetical protein
MGIYGQQSSNVNAANRYGLDAWNAEANAPNPWMEGLGMALGAAKTGASLAMM